MTQYTPAMQQYIDTKKEHEDCILFFRIGDFYETFFEDAKITSKVLDLILTSKNKNSENPIPMAGIPHHSAEKYIQKLVQHGYKVAIAEQTTQPTPGKIVEREVVSIVTPGTYIQESQKDFNFLVGIHKKSTRDGEIYHIARGDFSLGEYWTKSFQDIESMQKFINNLQATEVIFDVDITEKEHIIKELQKYHNCLVSVFEVPVDPNQYINNECNTQTLSSFGKALEQGRVDACALLFHYLKNTQKSTLSNISKIGLHSPKDKVLLDNISIKNLEIFSSSYEGQEKYSLIGVIDNAKTSGGKRLLRYMLANPINNLEELNFRLDQIQYYQHEKTITEEIHSALSQVSDIPKIVSNIVYRKTLASTFLKLKNTLDIFYGNEQNKTLSELERLGLSGISIDQVGALWDHLHKLLKEEDFSDEINYIKDGFDSEIDELRKIAFNSDKLLLDYQQELVEKTGVNNVKIKFIKNQGYFIEITNKDIKEFESATQELDIIRRNTLKGAQRYTSPYLDSLEQKIMAAREQLIQKELALLEQCKNNIIQINPQIHEFSQKIAYLDVFTSHAILAQENNFSKPELHTEKNLYIKDARHPVIEKYLPIDEHFIPNDLVMTYGADPKTQEDFGHTHIITGPNMGGKSTFLRQNALIVLMAHAGLYVPATSAKIPLTDGIFARVGSGDQIAKNQSTFMTEMIEVANILNNASTDSFIVFDELGRGTATYDGLALSKAILEFVNTKIQAKTLVATHYHELIQLEQQRSGIKNYSVSVYETDKDVVFMKKIISGGASKSYGIDVAKLAGIHPEIISQSVANLNYLEQHTDTKKENIPTATHNNLITPPPSIHDPKFEKIKTLLKSFDINNMTPLQAIQLLAKLKDEL